jgi:hypothetical protein
MESIPLDILYLIASLLSLEEIVALCGVSKIIRQRLTQSKKFWTIIEKRDGWVQKVSWQTISEGETEVFIFSNFVNVPFSQLEYTLKSVIRDVWIGWAKYQHQLGKFFYFILFYFMLFLILFDISSF